MERNRDVSFDILKGIGILSVIIGHNISFDSPIRLFIYSFHMPLFFLCAGYFQKNISPCTQIKKDFKRLVFPYLGVSVVLLLSSLLLWIHNSDYPIVTNTVLPLIWGAGGPHNEVLYFYQILPLTQLWFLLALFWGKTVSNLLPRNLGGVFLGLLLSVVATIIGRYIVFLPTDVNEGISAVIFIMVGVYIRDHGLNMLTFAIMIAAWIFSFSNYDLALSICEFDNYPIQILGAVGGTYVFLNLSKVLAKVHMFSRFLSWLGVNSMAILCMHTIESHTFLWSIIPLPSYYCLSIICKLGFCVVATLMLSQWDFTNRLFGIKAYKI